MKKVFSCLICICLMLLLCPSVGAAEDVTSVASREDLERIAERPSGSYELTADIDMGAEDWQPIPFSGRLNGNGHTIYNLTVRAPGADGAETYDGNGKKYDTALGGLFSTVTGAEISDLHLKNAVVCVETDRHCFLGAFAGCAADSVFTNCTVDCRNRLTVSSVNAGVGGMTGFSLDCEFDSCGVDAELVFTDVNTETPCESFLGGMYACGYGNVKSCAVRIHGFAEVYGYAHNGGVIGMFRLPQRLKKSFAVRDTAVDAEISFFEIAPSRRAYCDPLIGENLAGACHLYNNRVQNYQKNEFRTPVRLSPEQCEAPQYSEEITPPTCTEWGYTTYTCPVCGYFYRDRYTPAAHDYTEMRIEPTRTKDGSVTYTCAVCHDSYTEILPYIWAERVELTPETLNLPFLGQAQLSATVFPENVAEPGVTYSSADASAVTVSPDGIVTAFKKGTVVITCKSADERVKSVCVVTVTSSAWEWFCNGFRKIG